MFSKSGEDRQQLGFHNSQTADELVEETSRGGMLRRNLSDRSENNTIQTMISEIGRSTCGSFR